jgi:hypothetical protein
MPVISVHNKGAPFASTIAAEVSAAFAALPEDHRVIGVNIQLTNPLPNFPYWYDLLVEYDEDAATPNDEPYTCHVFEADSSEELEGLLNTFLAANAANFLSPVRYFNLNDLSRAIRKHVGIVFMSEDAVNGPDNWLAE